MGDPQPARCPIVPSPGVKGGIWGYFERASGTLLHRGIGEEGTSGGQLGRSEGWGQRTPVSARQLGGRLTEQFWGLGHKCQPRLLQQRWVEAILSFSLSAPAAASPGPGGRILWDPCPGAAEPRAENQQLQQRALFVKMKPVCASVPVSRLACPAALS